MSAKIAKLLWYPLFNSIVFNEDKYLRAPAESNFTITTQDFRLALLFWPDSTASSPTTHRQMVTKWDGNLDADSGWWLGYKPSDGSAYFILNDGGTGVTLSVAGAITNDAWNLVVVEADRGGNVVLYVNGVAKDSDDMSGVTGSIDKATEPFLLCRNNNFKGRIGYFSMDAYVYGAAWCLEEYYRIKYGWPRKDNINTDVGNMPQGVWNFNESLADESGSYDFIYMNSSFPTYYGAGYPSSCSLLFNYRVGSEMGFLPLDGTVRTQGGALRLHPGSNKLFSTLVISTNEIEKMIALQGAWLSRSYVDLWEDISKPQTLRGRIITAPRVRPLNGGFYEFTLEIEEQ